MRQMRSWRLVFALASILTAAGPDAAQAGVRDVASELGVPGSARSWDITTGDLDGDGVADVVVSYHDRVVFYRNQLPGLDPIFSHDGDDPHACTVADVDGDGLGDVYCTRGAGQGTLQKDNKLWLQTSPDTFENRADEFGVVDRWGRGRRTTFLDLDHDAFPDLFVGNGFPRADDHSSPNRTFTNDGDVPFTQVHLGVTKEVGAECVQAVDQNGDGWEDLLVCGSKRLHLYRRVPNGGFVDVAPGMKIDIRRPRGALIEDLDLDGIVDLAILTRTRILVLPGAAPHAFEAPVYRSRARSGRWLTVARFAGGAKPEIFVVESCDDTGDVGDLVLRPRPHRWGYRRVRLAPADSGCGDVAAPVDLDGDGRQEIVVLNGRPGRGEGPVQVLATRWLEA